MFDTISQSLNVPKPDLLSIVVQAPAGSTNGCLFCKKTILWNGGSWVHANDRPACAYVKCDGFWLEGREEPVEVPTFFGSSKKMAPVGGCRRCGLESAAWFFQGRWHHPGRSECPAAVARPINDHHTAPPANVDEWRER